jgi:hypothetical protein
VICWQSAYKLLNLGKIRIDGENKKGGRHKKADSVIVFILANLETHFFADGSNKCGSIGATFVGRYQLPLHIQWRKAV